VSENRMERLFRALDVTPVVPDPQFIEGLRRRVHNEATGTADSTIETTDNYTGDPIMTTIETDQPDQQDKAAHRAWLGIAAAVLLVIAVGAALILATRSEDSEEVATQTEGVTVDSALDVNEAYFAAFNAGDSDAVLALFTDDATFFDNFSGSVDQQDWELGLIWDMAQETTLTSPDCTVVEEVPATAVTISCEHETRDSLVQAVGAPHVPTTTTMTVTADGISDFSNRYGNPDFTTAGNPFIRWMEASHPEDAEAVGCCAGETFEESVARGELRLQYAKEWALYIEANDCVYNQISC
jgi:hypothetical protein